MAALLAARSVDHRVTVVDAPHQINERSHGALTFQLAKMAT
jgi:hypothetical protein